MWPLSLTSRDAAALALILLEIWPNTAMEEIWYNLLKNEKPHEELRPLSVARHMNEAIRSQLFLSQPAQFSSVAQSCPTLCNPMNHSTPGLPVHHQFPEFTQTHAHWVGNAIQPSHPLLSPSPPAHNPSSIRVFSNVSTLCMRRPKYWSFSFSISPSNEHPGLISFRMDWLDFLVVQGILKSLLQYHSSKASIFWCSAFFIVQTNPHGTEKNHYSHILLKVSSHRIIKINGYFKTLGNLFPSKS